jgi:hypothetical protein
LIKIDRRIFSKEYVPVEVFTTEHLYANSRIEGLIDYDLLDHPAEVELTGEAEE